MAGNPFVQEIDVREIELLGVVGKGSYGTVRKGKWRNQDVAVKVIETEQEKKAFIVEVQQLSRVDHVNIVKLYGACTNVPVCLIMEYAEGGSLYNVLHCMKQVDYTAAHALSWLLQTANGVAYLHNMNLIHRDLKPPNLLLINGGTVLKICDFGTACDKHTNMTNSKGSAAWMAPEVFEGSQYSEKCDVFSWGIILWEVLTRKKPFCDGDGATAFRIMWAVHNGKRPPLIQQCPLPLENLMTRCWAKDPKVRPSMSVVQSELSNILKYMSGADQPIIFLHQHEANITVETTSPLTTTEPKQGSTSSSSKTVLPDKTEQSIPEDMLLSVETAGERYAKDMKKRRSADFSNTDVKLPQNLGHRRSGSCDSPYLKAPDTTPSDIKLSERHVENIINFSEGPEPNYKVTGRNVPNEAPTEVSHGGNYFYLLEPKLQPLAPVQCSESIEIYEKHLNLARELFRYRNEIILLKDRRNELQAQLQARDKSSTYIDEYIHLKKEKESLLQLRQNLKRQLEIIRSKQEGNSNPTKPNGDEWVVV